LLKYVKALVAGQPPGLLESIKRYTARPAALGKKGTPLSATRYVCQIEKEEWFWAASCEGSHDIDRIHT